MFGSDAGIVMSMNNTVGNQPNQQSIQGNQVNTMQGVQTTTQG